MTGLLGQPPEKEDRPPGAIASLAAASIVAVGLAGLAGVVARWSLELFELGWKAWPF